MDQNEAVQFLKQKKAQDPNWQSLCLMCGRCCRLAVPPSCHDELIEKDESGDVEAHAFLNTFVPYSSWQEAKAAVPEHFERIVSEIKENDDFDINKVTFYHCQHVTDDNLCSIYEIRPECCKRAPAHGWSLYPPGCGFEGWQFEQREHQKRIVRNLKELLEELSLYGDNDVVTSDGQTATELREKILKQIEPWLKYGAKNW